MDSSNAESAPERGHIPVLLQATLELLSPQPGETFVDCTFGRGGHAAALAERLGPEGRLIAVDLDPDAIDTMKNWLERKDLPCRFDAIHGSFGELPLLLRKIEVSQVDGVFADLGVSSPQFDDASRGFSFRREAPLDMRMDPARGEPAASMIARLSEFDLARIIWEYGEEKNSRRIAKAIVRRRQEAPFETTTDLAEVVRQANPQRPSWAERNAGKPRIDAATRTFQALRIAVNDELGALDRLLENLPRLLRSGGRAAIIAFHSLEDRRVKKSFAQDSIWEILTRKPVTASEAEADQNPRSRSAKLRVARRR